MERKINVLVADDSQVARMLLVHLLESDPQIRVVGAVADGQSALDFVNEKRPDVVLMDIHMPHMDGFETTRRIMETQPVPIIICSGTTNPREVAITFRLMEVGAVACVVKPVAREHADFEQLVANLLQTVKLMSEVKVVRRWPRSRLAPVPGPVARAAAVEPGPAEIRVIGIGASTGGPPLLQTILAGLSKDFPVPILVVQHIARGFLPGLAEWLDQTTGFRVHVAAYGHCPLPGHVYLAPDDFHMGFSASGRILLTKEEPENGLRPAVSYLFRSLAEACGPNALGVLLSGMGRDGAAELKLMRDKGATTIAQDQESSVVHGMPGVAIELGAATHVLPAERMPEVLLALVNRRSGA
ncbi:MAG: chemotaxis-specific protein-glutamate methyltransferase CheB [Betaproteobacteria bacterium]|nr:chemotaxis-specific protein-glutamate methyltransferase CheB [Betaproteobacteria bacterium]